LYFFVRRLSLFHFLLAPALQIVLTTTHEIGENHALATADSTFRYQQLDHSVVAAIHNYQSPPEVRPETSKRDVWESGRFTKGTKRRTKAALHSH
jgi:hypothetical protein